jgi:hypothetical protein
MRSSFCKVISAAVIAVSFGFASAGASAGWLKVIDVDPTDSATNPGYPSSQSPSTLAAYLQDLLDLAAAPVPRNPQDAYGMLSGFGNPQASETFLLALPFGSSGDPWGRGPLNAFFYCQSECDWFPFPTSHPIVNFQLFSTIAESNAETPRDSGVEQLATPEPATLALLGLGLVGLAVSLRWKKS